MKSIDFSFTSASIDYSNKGINSDAIENIYLAYKELLRKHVDFIPPLVELNFAHNNLGDAGASLLAKLIRLGYLENLEKFDISYNRIYPSGTYKLCLAMQKVHMKKLKTFSFAHNLIKTPLVDDSASFMLTAALNSCKLLTKIDLSDVGFEGNPLAMIIIGSCIFNKKNLQILNISYEPIVWVTKQGELIFTPGCFSDNLVKDLFTTGWFVDYAIKKAIPKSFTQFFNYSINNLFTNQSFVDPSIQGLLLKLLPECGIYYRVETILDKNTVVMDPLKKSTAISLDSILGKGVTIKILPKIWENFRDLKYLDLSNNKIDSLAASKIIQDLSRFGIKLLELNLSNNKIDKFPSIEMLNKELQKVDFSMNNFSFEEIKKTLEIFLFETLVTHIRFDSVLYSYKESRELHDIFMESIFDKKFIPRILDYYLGINLIKSNIEQKGLNYTQCILSAAEVMEAYGSFKTFNDGDPYACQDIERRLFSEFINFKEIMKKYEVACLTLLVLDKSVPEDMGMSQGKVWTLLMDLMFRDDHQPHNYYEEDKELSARFEAKVLEALLWGHNHDHKNDI